MAYAPGVTELKLQLTQLSAVTTYSIYCILQAVDATTTGYNEARRRVTSFTTACCNSLVFSSGPSYVINDASVYLTGAASNTLFVVHVNSVPRVTLTIVPQLQCLSVLADGSSSVMLL